MKINLKKIGRRLLRITVTIVILVLSVYIYVYIRQEHFFFNPKVLEKDIALNALFFKTNHVSKGVILYFHGNAGAIHEWGERAPLYTENGFDILFVDYRGYGKNDGFYKKESELYYDAQKVYDYVKTRYNETSMSNF